MLNRPIILISIMLLLSIVVHGSNVYSAEKNSCIECHRNLPAESYAGHRFSDYTGSVHDKAGVRCEACHDGNASRSDKAGAHIGILRSIDPKSNIYYVNIPQTCGKCHGDELINFSRSRHYAELKMSGKGPTCVTCHGSMGTFILTSNRISEFCTVCHNSQKGIRPEVPRDMENVLSLMELTDTLVAWSGEFVADAKKQKKDTTESERLLAAARGEMKRARAAWHTFRMDDVSSRLTDAYGAAKKTKESIP